MAGTREGGHGGYPSTFLGTFCGFVEDRRVSSVKNPNFVISNPTYDSVGEEYLNVGNIGS